MERKNKKEPEVNPVFVKELNRLRANSDKLNSKPISISSELIDKKNLERMLKEYQEIKIPAVETDLFTLEMNFQNLNVDRISVGKVALESMPAEMENEKQRISAQQAVLKEELAVIEAKLKSFVDKEEKAEESQILIYGPRFSVQMRGGKPAFVDNAPVIEINGLSVIGAGLYKGMALADYRVVSDKYLKALQHAKQNKLMRLQAESRENGRPVPKMLPFRSLSRIDPNSLPDWPEGVMNHLEKQVVAK